MQELVKGVVDILQNNASAQCAPSTVTLAEEAWPGSSGVHASDR